MKVESLAVLSDRLLAQIKCYGYVLSLSLLDLFTLTSTTRERRQAAKVSDCNDLARFIESGPKLTMM